MFPAASSASSTCAADVTAIGERAADGTVGSGIGVGVGGRGEPTGETITPSTPSTSSPS